MRLVRVRAEDPARQHRRQRQRDDARHENRHRDHDRELVEQPSDDPAQKQNRNKYRDERDRHRQNGKANLARAVERRPQRGLSHLHVPNDVLQHDDRVVDDEPDGERQRHQRQIVQAIAEEIHDGKSADNGNRQREAGYNRRRHVA